MELLYSNILPVGLEENQKTIQDCFADQIANCDGVEIAVGYVSKASLEQLDALVEQYHIPHINLVIGMYYVEGMPESSYHAAVSLNQKWRDAGIGEIRLTKVFKYHGKLYAFLKDGQAASAIIGSANLGVIKLEANNRRQYEVSAVTNEPAECNSILSLIRKMQEERCSSNIADITDMTLIREVNTSLTGVDTVNQVLVEIRNTERYNYSCIHVLFWWGCHRVTRELSENKTTKACRTSSPGNRRRPSHANRRYL